MRDALTARFGRTPRSVSMEGSDELTLAIDVASSPGWWATWQDVDQLIRDTGWVAIASSWGPVERLYMSDRQGPDGADPTPRAVEERVPTVDVDAIVAMDRGRVSEPYPDLAGCIESALKLVRDDVREQLSVNAALEAIGSAADSLDVERWLLDHEGPTACPWDPSAGYLDWFEPSADDATEILVLPTPHAWAGAAWLGGFGWGWPHTDARAALLRRWEVGHGARVVANWGTMLQLVVERPPMDIASSWPIARDQFLVWPDTLWLPGIAVRHHAAALIGRTRWFLHNRP